MKNRSWITLILIAAVLVGFLGYRQVQRMRTDTVPPRITVPEGVREASVADSRTQLMSDVTAYDAVDGDVTDTLVVESMRLIRSDGTLNVTYAAFDSAGNVAKASREVRLTDYHSPRFQLNSPLLYAAGSKFDILSTLHAADILDGDIQHRIRANALDGSSIDSLGKHPVEFMVTNSLGDSVKLEFEVEVYSPTEYDAKLTLTNYLIYLKAGSDFTTSDYLDKLSFGSDTYSLHRSVPSAVTVQTEGTVDTRTPGVYTVSFRASFNRSMGTDSTITHTGYSKLIVVVEE